MRGLCRLASAFVLLCASAFCVAQELEYKYEIGVLGGASFYLGDANTNVLYRDTKLGGGAMFRYNINPRKSLKFNLALGGISGDASKSGNYIPPKDGEAYVFNNTVWDLGCQYELSFWGYGLGRSYKGTKRLTPYIQFGAGFCYCKELSMDIPVGFGIRYKAAERWNVGLDWTMRFSMTDSLDGIEDPYKIKSGFLKNKDSFCWTMLYVSYDICPKLRKCNND